MLKIWSGLLGTACSEKPENSEILKINSGRVAKKKWCAPFSFSPGQRSHAPGDTQILRNLPKSSCLSGDTSCAPRPQNRALVAHFDSASEVLLDIGIHLLVRQDTCMVLGFADLSRKTAPKEAVGLSENLVFSRFVLVSDKTEVLGLCPARHKPEPSYLPKPLKILQKIFFGGVLW